MIGAAELQVHNNLSKLKLLQQEVRLAGETDKQPTTWGKMQSLHQARREAKRTISDQEVRSTVADYMQENNE